VGQPVKDLLQAIKNYDPDFIIIQHEFGIFPKAGHFLQLLQGIDGIRLRPDAPLGLRTPRQSRLYFRAVKNIVVHTEEGKDILRKTGNNNNIFVVPHGCVQFPPEQRAELWNIFQTPYAIVQFGFGFYYKGVDTALEAISLLKKNVTRESTRNSSTATCAARTRTPTPSTPTTTTS
jgi:glycosyltransferase involved in cell wall biosynthesis